MSKNNRDRNMTQEEKQLLLKDLCARLPYGVRCKLDLAGYIAWNEEYAEKFKKAEKVKDNLFQTVNEKVYTLYGFPTPDRVFLLEFEGDENFGVPVEFIKPYLRPMSSMTSDEKMEWFQMRQKHCNMSGFNELQERADFTSESLDWLNKKGFDYRGLIPMGLALEAPENMYK